MLEDILRHHRGPYRLVVTRPFATKPGFFRSEWLKGLVSEKEDVGPEALALLEDKRDTINAVFVWSERDQEFVTTIRGPKDVYGMVLAKPKRRGKR